MNTQTQNMLERLTGVLGGAALPGNGSYSACRADAEALRRISMTLHRWHEMECGDSNDHSSWCVVRGKKNYVAGTSPRQWSFEYSDDGKPFIERHPHSTSAASYTPIGDRETGALKRLAVIMAKYPTLSHYVQTDPRGCALYILRPDDVPAGERAESYYSRGVAVHK